MKLSAAGVFWISYLAILTLGVAWAVFA